MPLVISAAARRKALGLRVWVIALLIVSLLLGAFEITIRSGWFWRLPLTTVLREPSDVNTRAAWRIHNIKQDPRNIIVLGSSMADAVVEPRGTIRTDLVDAAFGPGRVKLVNLAVFRSCYAEQMVLMENAIRAGHHPALVLIFSWPGCVSGDATDEMQAALSSERIPLFSHYLDDTTPLDSADDAVARWLMRHVAIARFRNYGNGWLRRRMLLLLKGRSPAIRRFRPDDRDLPYFGRWEDDAPRAGMVTNLAANLARNGPDVSGLARLLEYLQANGIRTVLVEAPWSPPVREKFTPLAAVYRQAVEEVTRAHGVQYLDVNPWVRFGSEHFHDTFHVDTLGGDLYLKAVVEQLAGAGL